MEFFDWLFSSDDKDGHNSSYSSSCFDTAPGHDPTGACGGSWSD